MVSRADRFFEDGKKTAKWVLSHGRSVPSGGSADLDKEIVPYLRAINSNPDAFTTGSCFGHGLGTPFFTIRFRNEAAAKYYSSQFRRVGFEAVDLGKPAGWRVSLPGVMHHAVYSIPESYQFWEAASRIVAQPMSSAEAPPQFMRRRSNSWAWGRI